MRLSDGRVLQSYGSFRFTGTQLDELARLANLDRDCGPFMEYAAAISEAAGAFLDFRMIHNERADPSRIPNIARSVSKKATALLAELNQLGPSGFHWLHTFRQYVDPDPKYSLFSIPNDDPEKIPEWHRQHSLAFYGGSVEGMAAYEQDPLRRAAWLREFMTELEMLKRIAEALGSVDPQVRRGPKSNAPRIIFARAVANAFAKHLRRRPTKGRDSEFERTLRFCLAAAGEDLGDASNPKDLHTLVATAIDGMNFDSP